jgi:hypothetical protein
MAGEAPLLKDRLDLLHIVHLVRGFRVKPGNSGSDNKAEQKIPHRGNSSSESGATSLSRGQPPMRYRGL